ncbi:MAG: O-antigen ligase family protein [Chitinophagaceae bacterium]
MKGQRTFIPDQDAVPLTAAPDAARKITAGHLALFLILLPFDRICTELVLISLLAHTIIHLGSTGAGRIYTRETLVLSAIFLLNLIALAWSPDKKEGVNYLVRQLAIILFPFMLSVAGDTVQLYRDRLLKVFGFTCVLVLLYLYADAIRIILYYRLPVKSLLSQAFLNHNFSAPIGLHATYLSAFVALSAVYFLHQLIREGKRKQQAVYGPCLLILFAGMIQLSSRAVLISFLLVVVLGFPFFIPSGKKRVRYLLLLFTCSLMALTGIIKVDSLKKRYVADLRSDLAQNSINNEVLESRLTRWKAIIPVALQSPVIGHGTGAEKHLLQNTYFEKRLYNSYLNELNTHNQYLKSFLETGLTGLFLFLFTIGWGIAKALKNRDIIFLSFMSITAVVSFSENMLDVNKGIFFYSFFFSFFVFGSKPRAADLRLRS